MDLSGPGIDVKLKERKKERYESFFKKGFLFIFWLLGGTCCRNLAILNSFGF